MAAPFEDVHAVFCEYDRVYFERALAGVRLEWSARMTSCAGICYMRGVRSRPATRTAVIRLSAPLLQYRPFSDVRSTLLHEMIHAYLWIRGTPGAEDRDGHGPAFRAHAARLSAAEAHRGVCVTVFHGFADEVAHHRVHVWRCTGACRAWAPYHGWVRRATNRAPQPADPWFAMHAQQCGGTFVKVAGPGAACPPLAPHDDRLAAPHTGPLRIAAPRTLHAAVPDAHVPPLAVYAEVDSVLECPACPRLFCGLAALNEHLDTCLCINAPPAPGSDRCNAIVID